MYMALLYLQLWKERQFPHMTRVRESTAAACDQVVAEGVFSHTNCIVKCLYAIWYPGNISRIISLPELRIKQYGFDLQMCLMAHSRFLVLCIYYNTFLGIICHIYLFPKENILRYN